MKINPFNCVKHLLLLTAAYAESATALQCFTPGNKPEILSPEVSIKYQSVTGAPPWMSRVWHEALIPAAFDCIIEDVRKRSLSLATFNSPDKGSFIFEGKSYLVRATDDSGIGLIIEAGPPDGPYTPLSKFRTKVMDVASVAVGERATADLLFRYRFVARTKVPPGLRSVKASGISIQLATLLNFVNRNTVTTGGAISINTASCKLTSPSAVALKSVNLSLMPVVGATVDGAMFNLGVSCPAAFAAYKVRHAMSDVNTPSNNTTDLCLAPALETVKGVGIQVIDGCEPVRFQPSNAGELPIMTLDDMGAAGGVLVNQLKARYVRVASEISPGQVNASVSIILSYD